ncbi:MAG TPA: mycofactocin-coupled SDR family oxidoreductase [Solirubrobacteraceae bacterium]|jgi:SDR family mycofactocin-dependent oxidoreductase
MGSLEGQIAYITGAARGQGRAIALRLARDGADIVACDICADIETVPYPLSAKSDLDETVRMVESLGRRCLAGRADVRNQDEVDAITAAALAEFGRIDILCANAGVFSFAPFWEISDDAWDAMFDVTAKGVWHAAKSVAPHMISQLGGCMVLTASYNGMMPFQNTAHYVAAKHAVMGLMKSFALELGPYDIRVNAVLPGAVNTKMVDNPAVRDWVAGHPNSTEQEYEAGSRGTSILRGRSRMSPSVIADAVAFLVSTDARNITGIGLPVDCGESVIPGINQNPIA